MNSGLKGFVGRWYEKALLRNNPYYFYGIPKADYSVRGETVELRKLGISVDRTTGRSVIQGYVFAKKIKEWLGGDYTHTPDGILLDVSGLRFLINSAEELFIIYEVFLTQVYHYGFNRSSVVVDIGMNSAISSLYFAREPRVEQIFAFELFKPTYQLGMRNLSLNPTFSGKVKAFDFGLSNRTFDTEVDYSPSRKGRMGLHGLPPDERFTDVVKEHVRVKEISAVFKELLDQAGSRDVVVKVDCEGEEYNLIESLSESGLLERISALMIEWHYEDPVRIEQRLTDAGFHSFSLRLPDKVSGMIYAARR